MRGLVSIAISVPFVSACFSPSDDDPLTDSDTEGATFGTESGSAEGMSQGDSISTQPTDDNTDTAPTSADETMTAPTSADDSTTAAEELGPRIVMSVPADGDLNAPLDGYFFLYFDRVVSLDDAVGHILVSQNGSEPQPISPMPCPPDADPTCIAGIFPKAFVDPEQNTLPGDAMHTITVEADFPDPDGLTNTMDQVVAFTTFAYESNFFDDSDEVVQEFGGIAYDDASESLFIVGVGVNFGDPCVVRRIPIPGGVAGSSSQVATPTDSYLCYGMDRIGSNLYVSGSYTDNVFRYSNLGLANFQNTETIIAGTTLPPPLADLSEVWSVAVLGTSTFFAHGEFTGGVEDTSILRLDGAVWSEFESGENLWDTSSNGVVLEGANLGGTDYLIVAADDAIRKFRVSDGTITSEHEITLDYAFDLHVDSQGRLWVGTQDGITVLEIADDTYEELARRPGLDTTRFAVREDGDTAHVYFARFRDVGLVGHLSIDF